jgi:hypothetical protein
MKLKIVTVQVVLLLSISVAAMAQNSNPGIPKGAQVDRPDSPEESGHGTIPPAISAHVLSNTPAAMASPANIPGGLYHVGNGYLSCPDVLPLTDGRPNLSGCTYRKDTH